MQQFTPAQWAWILIALDYRYGSEGVGAISGARLVDGSVTYSKLDETTVLAALDARYRDLPYVDIYVPTRAGGPRHRLRVRAEDLGEIE
jgi:hypothetical protein